MTVRGSPHEKLDDDVVLLNRPSMFDIYHLDIDSTSTSYTSVLFQWRVFPQINLRAVKTNLQNELSDFTHFKLPGCEVNVVNNHFLSPIMYFR